MPVLYRCNSVAVSQLLPVLMPSSPAQEKERRSPIATICPAVLAEGSLLLEAFPHASCPPRLPPKTALRPSVCCSPSPGRMVPSCVVACWTKRASTSSNGQDDASHRCLAFTVIAKAIAVAQSIEEKSLSKFLSPLHPPCTSCPSVRVFGDGKKNENFINKEAHLITPRLWGSSGGFCQAQGRWPRCRR